MKIFYFYFTLDILLCATILNCLISHFRVPKALTSKTRPSANTIFVQMRFFFCMRIRIVFISMALHLASLWNRDLGNFGIAHHKFEHCRHPSVSVRLLCSQKLTYEHSYYIVQFYLLQRFNLPSTSFKAHDEPGPLQGRLEIIILNYLSTISYHTCLAQNIIRTEGYESKRCVL